MNAPADARLSYQAAARYPTAYYGQLARARLGLDRIELRAPSPVLAAVDAPPADERVRAADMLYGVGERDMVFYFAEDFAKESTDVAALEALGELAGRRNDARVMLEVGKSALARGLALDHYAFPTIGIPEHKQVAPAIDPSVIYSVARAESSFDQRDKSAANAVGLMQVTPEAGRDTAKRFGLTYDWDKMVSDPVYNTQMGAAELSALMSGISRQPDHDLRRLQCRPGPRARMGAGARRPQGSQGRSGRLGRAHPAVGDAQLRPARDRERAGLSCEV